MRKSEQHTTSIDEHVPTTFSTQLLKENESNFLDSHFISNQLLELVDTYLKDWKTEQVIGDEYGTDLKQFTETTKKSDTRNTDKRGRESAFTAKEFQCNTSTMYNVMSKKPKRPRCDKARLPKSGRGSRTTVDNKACIYCGGIFARSSAARRHENYCKKSTNRDDKDKLCRTCIGCRKVFSTTDTLISHLQRKGACFV